MTLTITIMIIAAKTPYFAFGKATPLILLGLSSSLFLFSSVIGKKRAPHNYAAPKFLDLITNR